MSIKNFRKKYQRRSGIDLTSMMDIVFLLLIFLLLIANQSENIFNLSLTETKKGVTIKQLPKNKVTLNIFKNGNLYGYNKEKIKSFDTLITKINNIKDKKTSIILLVDKDAKAGVFIKLLSVLKKNNLNNLSIATSNEL